MPLIYLGPTMIATRLPFGSCWAATHNNRRGQNAETKWKQGNMPCCSTLCVSEGLINEKAIFRSLFYAFTEATIRASAAFQSATAVSLS
jgi:hypothetical protein